METTTQKPEENVCVTFYAVGPEEIDRFARNIERLCDSLRELRREKPESFFGHPVERMYDSLEASLASFYREAMSR